MTEINNRKAKFDYQIFETYEAGIVLTGTEIKSIRNGKCNLKDSYVVIRKNEAFILNMHISHYEEGNIFNHEETKEILKLNDRVRIEGYTIIPLKLYFNNNKAKLLIATAKGKKTYDKRETIKERDINRNIRKQLKGN